MQRRFLFSKILQMINLMKKKNLLNIQELDDLKTMGNRIENAMKNQNIHSVQELNEKIKKERGDSPDESVYHKIKYPPSGGTYNLSIAYLLVIADALGVTTDYLLKGIKK